MAINFREACFGRRVSSRSEWRHDVYYAVFCLVLSTPSNEFFSWSRPWGSSAIFYNAAAGFLTLFSAIFHKNVLVKDLAAFFAYLAVAVAEVESADVVGQLLSNCCRPAGRVARSFKPAGPASHRPTAKLLRIEKWLLRTFYENCENHWAVARTNRTTYASTACWARRRLSNSHYSHFTSSNGRLRLPMPMSKS